MSYGITYMHNLKNNTNGLTYDRNWVSENMLVVAKGKELESRMDWELGISRCKLLLYTGWINNKILIYSTGN